MKTFAEIREAAENSKPGIMAVVMAADSHVLAAVKEAKEKGVFESILFGHSNEIKQHMNQLEMKPEHYQIVDVADPVEAATEAVEMCSRGEAGAMMKGQIATGILMKAVLNKDAGLMQGALLSHVWIAEIEKRLYFVTDGGMNVYPSLKEKVGILENALSVAWALGIEKPRVAPIGAVEVVNPSMEATSDAAALSQMADRGQFKNCYVDGPLALDNAVSPEAAEHKGLTGEVPGKADILLVPDIETGNILGKSMKYLVGAEAGGLIVGAKVPIILTSRADDEQTKYNAMAVARMFCCGGTG